MEDGNKETWDPIMKPANRQVPAAIDPIHCFGETELRDEDIEMSPFIFFRQSLPVVSVLMRTGGVTIKKAWLLRARLFEYSNRISY